jgi:hypothetical protein
MMEKKSLLFLATNLNNVLIRCAGRDTIMHAWKKSLIIALSL